LLAGGCERGAGVGKGRPGGVEVPGGSNAVARGGTDGGVGEGRGGPRNKRRSLAGVGCVGGAGREGSGCGGKVVMVFAGRAGGHAMGHGACRCYEERVACGGRQRVGAGVSIGGVADVGGGGS